MISERGGVVRRLCSRCEFELPPSCDLREAQQAVTEEPTKRKDRALLSSLSSLPSLNPACSTVVNIPTGEHRFSVNYRRSQAAMRGKATSSRALQLFLLPFPSSSVRLSILGSSSMQPNITVSPTATTRMLGADNTSPSAASGARSPSHSRTRSLSPGASSSLNPSPTSHQPLSPRSSQILGRPSPVVPSPSLPASPASFSRPSSPRPYEPASPTRQSSQLPYELGSSGMLSRSGSAVDLSHVFERGKHRHAVLNRLSVKRKLTGAAPKPQTSNSDQLMSSRHKRPWM